MQYCYFVCRLSFAGFGTQIPGLLWRAEGSCQDRAAAEQERADGWGRIQNVPELQVLALVEKNERMDVARDGLESQQKSAKEKMSL